MSMQVPRMRIGAPALSRTTWPFDDRCRTVPSGRTIRSIIWYGYSYQPAVYAYLNKLAPLLDRPLYHLVGTRLALYSRWDIVVT